MNSLAKLSIGLLIILIEGFAFAGSEVLPFAPMLIVAVLYGGWCESYILSFIVGFLSVMSYPLAINFFYTLQGRGIEAWSVFFKNVALEFFVLGIIFGIIGIVSTRFVLWFRKKINVGDRPSSTT